MDLYLVRHAAAFERDPESWPDDSQRPLTPKGKKRFGRAARGLKQIVPEVELLLSSPYTRAWETARILEDKAHWIVPIRFEALQPEYSPAQVVEALRAHAASNSIALVGHEPNLHELASYLLAGDAELTLFEMEKGGVVGLHIEGDLQPRSASLLWLLTPDVLKSLQ